MKEIDFTFKIPEGDPVKGGRIPKCIPPDAICQMIARKPIMVYDPDFGNYFQLRLREHEIIHERTKSGESAREDEELKRVRERIAEVEEQNPSFQDQLTKHLNSVIDAFK